MIKLLMVLIVWYNNVTIKKNIEYLKEKYDKLRNSYGNWQSVIE